MTAEQPATATDFLADVPDLSLPSGDVPLGVQVVDWQGLAAQIIPEHSPTYPTDIYAVLANLQAWRHDDPTQAQVLYSDGDGALLVYAVP